MTPGDLDFTERAPGRWEAITRTGREFTITWSPTLTGGLWCTAGPPYSEETHATFARAVRWCAEQCTPDDEEPF